MSGRERRHAVTGEVMRSESGQMLVFVQETEQEPRAELPAALPVAQEPSDSPEDGLGEPMGIREVARMIGCSAWTVRQQCLRQGLPHFRASRTGRLIFYRAQVVAWILENQKGRRW